jgi:chemotaxis family two-component system response regulator Rcp1
VNSRPIRLLVIDDSPAFHRLVAEAFESLGSTVNWTLTFIADGEEALNVLSAQDDSLSPDLILLDWHLPDISGDMILKRLKADWKLKRIPVLVLSSSDSKADIEKAYEYHANGFITKPLQLDALFRTVKIIVDFWTTVVQLPRLGSTISEQKSSNMR